jgi:hypothetical protein
MGRGGGSGGSSSFSRISDRMNALDKILGGSMNGLSSSQIRKYNNEFNNLARQYGTARRASFGRK